MADEMVTDLRSKIERMGAVNMMASTSSMTWSRVHVSDRPTQRSCDAIARPVRHQEDRQDTKERFRRRSRSSTRTSKVPSRPCFGGGRAGLILLDENDQLESGIDIIAQPQEAPTERAVLSGGGKGLTAMALMLRHLKYRPSPFCLLDEIDAPLGRRQHGRFVEMLRACRIARSSSSHAQRKTM